MLIPFTEPLKLIDFPPEFDHEGWSLLLLLGRDGQPTFDYSCVKIAAPDRARRKRRKISDAKEEATPQVEMGDLEDVSRDLNLRLTENIPRQHQWSTREDEKVFLTVRRTIQKEEREGISK